MSDYERFLSEKAWNLEIEKQIAVSWRNKNPFLFDKKKIKSGKVFSIDTPPPYVNSPIHMGHAVTYSYMDFFARYKRMKGFSVLFPLGLDRNGLPIEMAAQKKFNVDPGKIGREKFIEYCKKILEEASIQSVESFARLGISFNSYEQGNEIGDVYLTDAPDYRILTQATFYDLWEKGLVYEDKKVSNYCPGCKTTLADAEIVYQEKQTKLVHVIFKTTTGKELVIATTRPELLGACAAVIYHPDDERYLHFKKEKVKVVIPLYSKEVPLIAHPSAQPEFGSGLVMMCSFGDLTDIRFFKEQKIKPEILIEQDGKLNGKAGFLQGLSVKEAREKIIQMLKAKEMVMKEETLMNRAPVCERSKDSVEFIELEEYYLKQIEFKEKMMELQKEISFYAPESRKILESWIASIDQDWPLSRRRYYATPIPLWKCKSCGEVILGEKGKYAEPWTEKKKCKKCGKEAVGETRVFDTWFDSSISELYIAGFGKDDTLFKKIYPVTLRPQGKEIVRTWLYYTLLRGYLATGKACFKDVWINHHILDASRKKMAKSVGNVIDPQHILEQEGSEALRLWSAIEGDLSKQDLAFSEEKVRAEQKTLTKLWNVAKFIFQFQEVKRPKKLLEIDQLFLDYMDIFAADADDSFQRYDFHTPLLQLRYFLWETFASHYLELVKNRAYNQNKEFSQEEQDSAISTLYDTLKKLLILFYPVIPMITSVLYEKFGNILQEKFSDYKKMKEEDKKDIERKIQLLMEFNSKIWKEKRDKGLSLKSPMKEILAPGDLKIFERDLKACHSAERVIYI